MAIKRFTIGLTWGLGDHNSAILEKIDELLNDGWERLDIASYPYDGEVSQDWTLYKPDAPDAGKRAIGIPDTEGGGSVEYEAEEADGSYQHLDSKYRANRHRGFWRVYEGNIYLDKYVTLEQAIEAIEMYIVMDAESTQATPPAASEATGYTVVMEDGYAAIYRGDDSTVTNHVATFDYASDASVCIEAIVNETAALRTENARLQAQLESIGRDLLAATERVKELQTRINDARYIVGDMPNHPDGIDKLYDKILDLTKPYSSD